MSGENMDITYTSSNKRALLLMYILLQCVVVISYKVVLLCLLKPPSCFQLHGIVVDQFDIVGVHLHAGLIQAQV